MPAIITAPSERIVERVTLTLSTAPPRPAVMVSKALVPWRPPPAAAHSPAGPPAAPASPASPARAPTAPPCRVQLSLVTRRAEPHELAADAYSQGAAQEPALRAVDRRVRVVLEDGSAVYCSAPTLAEHSSVLGMLSGCLRDDGESAWREARTGEIALVEHPAAVVSGVLEW
eukprot:187725-Prymnesium_polylepis.1